MFNIGSSELVVIAVVALLILGPKRLPELARGIGKFVREFRRQTDEVRGVVEREFYRMDQDVSINEPPPSLAPAAGAQPVLGQPNRPVEPSQFGAPREAKALSGDVGTEDTLARPMPVPDEPVRSQLTAGMPGPSPEPEPSPGSPPGAAPAGKQ